MFPSNYPSLSIAWSPDDWKSICMGRRTFLVRNYIEKTFPSTQATTQYNCSHHFPNNPTLLQLLPDQHNWMIHTLVIHSFLEYIHSFQNANGHLHILTIFTPLSSVMLLHYQLTVPYFLIMYLQSCPRHDELRPRFEHHHQVSCKSPAYTERKEMTVVASKLQVIV
jgi:hypothetical protein